MYPNTSDSTIYEEQFPERRVNESLKVREEYLNYEPPASVHFLQKIMVLIQIEKYLQSI